MKYLPRFKWHMLTEQVGACGPSALLCFLYSYVLIAHEAAVREAKLRLELGQSRAEQRDYLANVELARVLDKRAERAQASGKDPASVRKIKSKHERDGESARPEDAKRRKKVHEGGDKQEKLDSVLSSIF